MGQTGRKVEITGHNILLDSNTTIDVSGHDGGGNIFIGGNKQSIGPLAHANALVMKSDVDLTADALVKVTVVLSFSGLIMSPKHMAISVLRGGGSASGNGGYI